MRTAVLFGLLAALPLGATDSVEIPENARLNYAGDGWVCDKGLIA